MIKAGEALPRVIFSRMPVASYNPSRSVSAASPYTVPAVVSGVTMT